MRSVKELIGKPVVAVDTGDRIGTVSDALLEDEAGRGSLSIVGLVIGGGLLAQEHVMPFRDVQTIGGDTILARSHAGMVGAREWRESGVRSTRVSLLKGRPVVSTTGQRLGELSDLLIDEQTGTFSALEVAASDLGGLRTRRSLLQPVTDVRIGPDAVLVPESAMHSGTRQAEEGALHPRHEP